MHDVTARDDYTGVASQRGDWVRLRLPRAAGRPATIQLASRPDRPGRVLSSVPAPEGRSLIARGGGQSHGDAAVNDGGAVTLTSRLDRMLSFDAADGVLVAEAGVTIGDILCTFLPRGYAPAVCPGTSRATIGGAIASDVCGDNHVRVGAFGTHVLWIDLVTARGGLRRISRLESTDLFEATIGGLGLTGIIVRAAVRLAPVASPFVSVRREAVGSLDALLEQLEEAARTHDYATAWLDTLATGLARGRGVLQTADASAIDRRRWRPLRREAAPPLPGMVARMLPRHVLLQLLNERTYRQSARRDAVARAVSLDRLLFRPNLVRAWQRLYGRGGVAFFQCALPSDGATAAVRRLLDIVCRSGAAVQATARALGGGGDGMLNAAMPGVNLSLGLPAAAAAPDLMHRLERETLDRGGRVFLIDDAHLTDYGFSTMYPRGDAFRAVLGQVDPDMRLQSDLARRLRLRDYAV